jgi:hypothetical protein
MKPYDENIQTFAAMFSGYDQALRRLEAAVGGTEPAPAFIALFEALNWAVALDDRAGEHWAPEGKTLGFGWRDRAQGAYRMRAVRFARNSVHHQWSDALRLHEIPRALPMSLPARCFEWRWRPLSELPVRPTKKGAREKARQAEDEAEYQEKLEDKPVDKTLQELGQAFYMLRILLEPGSIPRRGYKPPIGLERQV